MVSLQLGVGVFCSFWLGGHSCLVYSLYALRLFCLLLIYVLTYQKKNIYKGHSWWIIKQIWRFIDCCLFFLLHYFLLFFLFYFHLFSNPILTLSFSYTTYPAFYQSMSFFFFLLIGKDRICLIKGVHKVYTLYTKAPKGQTKLRDNIKNNFLTSTRAQPINEV